MVTKRIVVGVAAAALALGSLIAAESAQIHQEVEFKSGPQRIYKALLDSKQFSAFTASPAQIHATAGGAFNCFGGRVVGRNIELVPNRRIVQAWRISEWPEGLYSIVRFELKTQGSGTRLILDHAGFAPEDREHLDPGWHQMYWDPLTKYLGE
jgi:activator of HSP90 ATPase